MEVRLYTRQKANPPVSSAIILRHEKTVKGALIISTLPVSLSRKPWFKKCRYLCHQYHLFISLGIYQPWFYLASSHKYAKFEARFPSLNKTEIWSKAWFQCTICRFLRRRKDSGQNSRNSIGRWSRFLSVDTESCVSKDKRDSKNNRWENIRDNTIIISRT